jgi:hypothetical protein
MRIRTCLPIASIAPLRSGLPARTRRCAPTQAGPSLLIAAVCWTLCGCAERAPVREDAGSAPDSGIATHDGGAPPDAARADAAVDGGTSTSCEPSPGDVAGDAYCDLFELAIFKSDDASPEARLHGRVSPDALVEDGCAVIDEVEVQQAGTTVATLEGIGGFHAGDDRALLATGGVSPEMSARCEGDDRFGGFGFIVRGRVDGGTFEARCADAEGGSRWPPAVRLTCHHNVDRQPFSAYAGVSSSAGFAWSTIDVSVPHDPGGALLSADATLRVIPTAIAFGPPAPPPFDSAGWSATLSEATGPLPGSYTSVSFTRDDAAFDTTLCPPPSTAPPGPDFEPPPVFLVRFTGTSERGAYSTEGYVGQCNTLSM